MNQTSSLPGLVLGALALCLAGCATHKERPAAQRGWIGGQCVLAKKVAVLEAILHRPGVEDYQQFPESVRRTQKAAVLVKHLGTNAPAYRAGLRQGDLIVELDHRPAVRLKQFHRTIEASLPGTSLPVKVYRDGQTAEYTVAVGRETYRRGGEFRLVLPSVVHGWDLWPNPGFSLVLLGYEPNRDPAKDATQSCGRVNRSMQKTGARLQASSTCQSANASCRRRTELTSGLPRLVGPSCGSPRRGHGRRRPGGPFGAAPWWRRSGCGQPG